MTHIIQLAQHHPIVSLTILAIVLITAGVIIKGVFAVDVDTPLVRSILALVWLCMACLALRDVIDSKRLNVDSLLGLAFCAGGVIFNVWPRRKDTNERELSVLTKKR